MKNLLNTLILSLIFLTISCSENNNGNIEKEKETIDKCENITCDNHGTCTVVDDSPTCICNAGYHVENTNCIEDGEEIKIPDDFKIISLINGSESQKSIKIEGVLSYKIPNLPYWALLNESTGLITLKPTELGHGLYDIEYTTTTGVIKKENSLRISVYPKKENIQTIINTMDSEDVEKIMDSNGTILTASPQFFANPDGLTWTVCIPYYESYGSKQQIITIDLSTGNIGVNDSINFATGSWNMFKSTPSINNKSYINPKSGGDGLIRIHSYDTSTHTWDVNVIPTNPDHKGTAQPSAITTGVNKRIYSLGANDAGKLSVLEINPIDNSTRFYNNIESSGIPRDIAADNNYVYVLENPYGASKVIAINLETNERTVLLESASASIYQRKYGVIASLNNTYYWLYENQAIVTNDLNNNPPWGFDDTDLYQKSNAIDTPLAITDIETKSLIPANGTIGKFWYIDPNTATNEYVSVNIPNIIKHPVRFNLLQKLNNEKILFLTQGYSGYSIFDINQLSLKSYVPIDGRISNYTSSISGDKVYISGYFGGGSFEYDTTKEWNNTISENYNPNEAIADLNPKYLGGIGNIGNIGKPYGSAIGKDGLFYIGGERIRTGDGGGLATYNPQTGENLGILEGFEQDDVKNVVRADKYIVAGSFSTNSSHPIRLSVYDTELKEIVKIIEIDGIINNAGKLINEFDDKTIVYLLTKTDDNLKTKIIKLDVETGDILFNQEYPLIYNLSNASILVKGDDGFLYSLFGINTLIRIDPESGYIEPSKKLSSGIWGFGAYGNDLYLTGINSVSKISNYKVFYNFNTVK